MRTNNAHQQLLNRGGLVGCRQVQRTNRIEHGGRFKSRTACDSVELALIIIATAGSLCNVEVDR